MPVDSLRAATGGEDVAKGCHQQGRHSPHSNAEHGDSLSRAAHQPQRSLPNPLHKDLLAVGASSRHRPLFHRFKNATVSFLPPSNLTVGRPAQGHGDGWWFRSRVLLVGPGHYGRRPRDEAAARPLSHRTKHGCVPTPGHLVRPSVPRRHAQMTPSGANAPGRVRDPAGPTGSVRNVED